MEKPRKSDCPPDEGALLRRSADGDHEAFRCLVERYRGLVFSCALGVTGNTADAADVSQEAFVRLYRHIDRVDPERPLRPYLLTLTVNCARNVLRTRSRRPAESMEELSGADGDPADESHEQPVHRYAADERHRAVRSLVAALPGVLRDVCVLFYLADRSVREVASALRMSEGAVKVALHRARKRLLDSGIAEWKVP